MVRRMSTSFRSGQSAECPAHILMLEREEVQAEIKSVRENWEQGYRDKERQREQGARIER